MKRTEKESGKVIVEASLIFPAMFLVVFLMIFAGNAYLQKCRIEAMVNKMAIDGAAYCADPLLNGVKETGEVPSLQTLNVQPYRYFFVGGMNAIAGEIKEKIEDGLADISTGIFTKMKPVTPQVAVDFNNGFIYSTFSVDIEYDIEIPVKLLGAAQYIPLQVSSRANMPVSDSAEFIRNADMVEDYIERYTGEKPCDKIAEMIDKVKEWFNKP